MKYDNLPRLFILGQLSNSRCNLRCPYCYISARELWDRTGQTTFKYSVSHMLRCLSPKRLGGIALINLTGLGETLLQEGVIELINGLLDEGHYLEVVTNGIAKDKIYKLLDMNEENLKRLEFKISYHYSELKRLNILDSFLDTVEAIKESKASFTLELMPYDGLECDIHEVIDLTIKRFGAKPQITVGRDDRFKNRKILTEHTVAEYKRIWSVFQSPMFDFKMKIMGKKCKGFCYAGKWSFFVDLNSGDTYPCYGQPSNQNIFENIDQPIKYEPVGYYCTEPYCINGHAHLTMGLNPQVKTPTFAEIRNRVCADGREWMKESCKEGFNLKLYQRNKEYGRGKKIVHTFTYPFKIILWCIKKPKINLEKINRFLNLRDEI